MKRNDMVSTEITMDIVMQLNIKLPVEIDEEEAKTTIMENIHWMVTGLTLSKGSIAEKFKVPHYFVVARGYIDEPKKDSLRVQTWREERK